MKTHNLTIETKLDTDAFPVPVRRLRNEPSRISHDDPASDRRTYLRRMRAAEMAAWEQTGGDYLRSDYDARRWQPVEPGHRKSLRGNFPITPFLEI